MNYPSKKIWAIVGARSGSKGIKDKNIVDLAGKPLLAYSIETALAVPEIDRVIVSTDSAEYAFIAAKYGAEIVMRPAKLAKDSTPDYPWIRHLIGMVGYDMTELLVLLRPTTPLRDPCIVTRAIEAFLANQKATSLRSVHEMAESAYKMCRFVSGYLRPIGVHDSIDDISEPRQHYITTYKPNGYIDIIDLERVLVHGHLYGDRVLPFITPRVTEVDTPEDLEYLRYQMGG